MRLPPDFFKCSPLTPEDYEEYTDLAMQNKRDLLEKADISNPQYKWKRVADEAEVEIFRGRDPYRPTSASLFCSTAEIAATLDEVANFFRMWSRDEFKEMVDRTDLAYLDTATLYTIHKSPDLKIRLQWMLEKTPFDVVGKKRDFCCLVSSRILRDENGRRAYVNSAASIQSPCCPEFPNVIRTVHLGSGIICRDSARPGYLELMLIAHCDLRGVLPNAIKERTAMDLCRMIQTIDRNLRQDRLTGTPFLTGDQLVERSSRQQCKLCQRKFCFFRQKKNCFKCGE
ncbi:unnamed protein product, partial [Aphanomyces euteiches]